MVAGLAAGLALAMPALAAKKKGGGAVNITKAANAPIPDEALPQGPGLDGVLNSTIEVGKQFKGRKVRDVNVTVQTTGTSNMALTGALVGPVEAINLVAILRAPNGARAMLFGTLLPPFTSLAPATFAPFPSIGPLTLDDEAALNLGVFEPHAPDELYAPYAGTAQPFRQLAIMDGGPVRGTWTLTMVDTVNTGTSNLTSWRLNVIPGRPFQTK